MAYGLDRIPTTQVGNLPRSPALTKMVYGLLEEGHGDERAVHEMVRDGISSAVRKQIDLGIDIINDGELGKANFLTYVRERIGGFEVRPPPPGTPARSPIISRDFGRFAGYFEKAGGWPMRPLPYGVCVEPLKYVGQAKIRADIEAFKHGLAGKKPVDAFLSAVAPGAIDHWLHNEFYATEEEFIFAVGEAMRPEYLAIVEAGFLLQIDDPGIADSWQIQSRLTVPEYRKYAELRVEALNHALRGIPKERVRLHMCWGSNRGPHLNDLPLSEFVDIVFKVDAGQVSIEASNPRHEHEWRVFEDFRMPEGVVLVPGVVGHATDFIEHPQVVSDRLVRYAKLIGRENLIAGTDCGLGSRTGDPEIAWAKLEALRQGAELATRQLWNAGHHSKAKTSLSENRNVDA